jgi:MSHA type pilus biogenesis protein MshL
MLRIVGATLTALLLTACAPTTLSGGPSAGHLQASDAAKTQGTIPQPLQQSVPLPRPKAAAKTETYSVVVNNVKVQDLLFALARDAKLNVDIHPGITGYVTLNAIDQTLPQLLTRISKQVDMRFELDGPNLAVMPDTPFLRTYHVDYVNLTRDMKGNVDVASQVSSTTSSTGQATGVGQSGTGTNSSLGISIAAKNHFWENLEKNLKDILRETDKILPEGSSETTIEANAQRTARASTAQSTTNPSGTGNLGLGAVGQQTGAVANSTQDSAVVRTSTFREAASVIVNSEGGIVSVRATSKQHLYVQEYLDALLRSLQRQVLIEATIVEVSLSENNQQGIDWSRLRSASGTGFEIIQTGASVVGNAIEIGYKNPDSALGNISATVKLLDTFGTVKILSSPKLAVLNNQTAVLKVVDNLVYFTVSSSTNQNANNTTTTYSTTLNSVPVGLVLNVTPQISNSESIILNIRPSISRRYAWADDPNPDLKKLDIKNQVPVIRTREMDSMIRVSNGNIAVMGGLMEDTLENNDTAVPGVSNVPLFGKLFQNRDDTRRKTELVIFLRPTVVRDADIRGDYSDYGRHLPTDSFFNDTAGPAKIDLPNSKRSMQ